MSLPSSPTLLLDLRQRRWDVRVAVAISIAAAAAPLLLLHVVTWPLLALASALIVTICAMGLHRANWMGARRLVRAGWQPDGYWLLSADDGRTELAVLSSSSRMSPAVIWLHWTLQNSNESAHSSLSAHPNSLLLFRGDLPRSDFRRLLVRLRMDRSEWKPLTTRTAHP